MILRTLLIATCLFLAAPVQADPALEAELAALQLAEAATALQDAENAQDRVTALTRTVQAYEHGLAAVRANLRDVGLREQSAQDKFDTAQQDLAIILGTMQQMGQTQKPVGLSHVNDPVATARAGMLLVRLTPGLQSQADMLRSDLEQISILRQLQASALQKLETGLIEVQQARTQLALAISNRNDLPSRFTEDPVRTAILLDASETLDAFASGLIDDATASSGLPDFNVRRGTLPLPATGEILRGFNEPDAAGVVRPGILIQTDPRALVTTPTAATLRYNGPLLDFGNVVILEPAADTLLILVGLHQVYGRVGDVLPAGAPVGFMGGNDISGRENLSRNDKPSSVRRKETLYIELRQDQTPVDPGQWFQVVKE
ncbi:murein hydrolase activator EnvC family protein [Parasulfitobacter algicola]|uniref:Peptidase M23 n=1 Tax=Parasulfitobacter algicola TaxID=2614809 RepID=A0ABX2IV25_9RHOB|nr:peptidase M23 [Sulfitobacter algicola]NSX55856.1 peptidase M23 [Sulfitobacter algicola]